MITNKIQHGSYSTTELLTHGQIPLDKKPNSLHSQTKYITTKAIRIGGGYELQRIEKPVVEDKERIKLLKHLISIKQASKNDLLNRINFMINENTRLAGFNERLESENYHDSLLQQQRILQEIQKIQKEKDDINRILLEKKESFVELKNSTDSNILRVSESLERVQDSLKVKKERLFELKHFEEASKPKLCIKTQELIDELEKVKKDNFEKETEERLKMERRIEREKKDKQDRVDKILTRATDSVIAKYGIVRKMSEF